MSRILIANVCNPSMVRDSSIYGKHMLNGIAASAERMLWLACDRDIVVGMRPISDRIVELRKHYEPSFGTPKWVYPSSAKEGQPVLLDEKAVLACVEELMDLGLVRGKSWGVEAYYNNGSICEVERRISHDFKLKSEFMRSSGADVLNSKSLFRQLTSCVNTNLAAGAVCTGREQFVSETLRLLDEFGKVMVKQDRHAGSAGNIALSILSEALVGASRTVTIRDNRRVQCEMVFDEIAGRHDAPVVVERYYDTDRIMYCEYSVTESEIELYGFGVLRVDASGDPRGDSAPTWSGFEIPGPNHDDASAEFVAIAMRLAKFYQGLGYQGKINIDGILTNCGQLIINEVNGRLGGCSHIHAIARRYHGVDYWNRVYITSRIRQKVSSFHEHLSRVRSVGVDFQPENGIGVLTLVDDTKSTGEIEYMVIAEDRKQALEFEAAGLIGGGHN